MINAPVSILAAIIACELSFDLASDGFGACFVASFTGAVYCLTCHRLYSLVLVSVSDPANVLIREYAPRA